MNREREIRAAIDAGESDGYPSDDAYAALTDLVTEINVLRTALEYIADPDEHHSVRARLIASGALDAASR